MAFKLVCGDILLFQEQLKQMRDLDDKVIYALNNSLPTASIKARTDSNPKENCKELYEKLKSSYANREKVIQECIILTAEQVSQLKKQRETNDDTQLDKNFKNEQRKLRVLKQELGVEEIVKERSLKTFNERCRSYFRADSF
ncbi:CLUMA_CG012044, isoform A [Clunio marinus]|uniref:Protein MIX23 n=1 Tax=Clunio marinus TaxID=568069 RepID=A0A1J1IGF3_9DIPT|nr:CLUMA_CG012044, isoform A [Clunio marinus]